MISSRPHQKIGIEKPVSEMPISVWSNSEPRLTAATMPAGRPTSSASSMATTRQLDRGREPGEELLQHRLAGVDRGAEVAAAADRPGNARTARSAGRSKPYCAISAACRSAVMPRSPTIIRIGSPGISRIRMNAMKVTPRKVGIRTASRAPRNRSMSATPPPAGRGRSAVPDPPSSPVDSVPCSAAPCSACRNVGCHGTSAAGAMSTGYWPRAIAPGPQGRPRRACSPGPGPSAGMRGAPRHGAHGQRHRSVSSRPPAAVGSTGSQRSSPPATGRRQSWRPATGQAPAPAIGQRLVDRSGRRDPSAVTALVRASIALQGSASGCASPRPAGSRPASRRPLCAMAPRQGSAMKSSRPRTP